MISISWVWSLEICTIKRGTCRTCQVGSYDHFPKQKRTSFVKHHAMHQNNTHHRELLFHLIKMLTCMYIFGAFSTIYFALNGLPSRDHNLFTNQIPYHLQIKSHRVSWRCTASMLPPNQMLHTRPRVVDYQITMLSVSTFT